MKERTSYSDTRKLYEALQLLNTELPTPEDETEEEEENQRGARSNEH